MSEPGQPDEIAMLRQQIEEMRKEMDIMRQQLNSIQSISPTKEEVIQRIRLEEEEKKRIHEEQQETIKCRQFYKRGITMWRQSVNYIQPGPLQTDIDRVWDILRGSDHIPLIRIKLTTESDICSPFLLITSRSIYLLRYNTIRIQNPFKWNETIENTSQKCYGPIYIFDSSITYHSFMMFYQLFRERVQRYQTEYKNQHPPREDEHHFQYIDLIKLGQTIRSIPGRTYGWNILDEVLHLADLREL